MPPEMQNDQELSLKKRARRRLVGAIALVFLMVIILPMVLQDRAEITPKDAIKITMPKVDEVVESDRATQQGLASATATSEKTDAVIALNLPKDSSADLAPIEIDEPTLTPPQVNNIVAVIDDAKAPVKSRESKKNAEVKKAEVSEKVTIKLPIKSIEVKPSPLKSVATNEPVVPKTPSPTNISFTIQVGVYSDLANVKQLQVKLKEAGFVSHTENITTPKGEKIRLRAGKYHSRQDAADALDKLKSSGLTGMVISND